MGGKIRQVGSAKTMESASPDVTPMSSSESIVPDLDTTLRIEIASKDRELMDVISSGESGPNPFYATDHVLEFIWTSAKTGKKCRFPPNFHCGLKAVFKKPSHDSLMFTEISGKCENKTLKPIESLIEAADGTGFGHGSKIHGRYEYKKCRALKFNRLSLRLQNIEGPKLGRGDNSRMISTLIPRIWESDLF